MVQQARRRLCSVLVELIGYVCRYSPIKYAVTMVNQTVKFDIVSVKAIMFEVNKTMIALILLVLLVIPVNMTDNCKLTIDTSTPIL